MQLEIKTNQLEISKTLSVRLNAMSMQLVQFGYFFIFSNFFEIELLPLLVTEQLITSLVSLLASSVLFSIEHVFQRPNRLVSPFELFSPCNQNEAGTDTTRNSIVIAAKVKLRTYL